MIPRAGARADSIANEREREPRRKKENRVCTPFLVRVNTIEGKV